MGLDIFIHKVKNVRNSKCEPLKSIKEYAEINAQRAKDKIKAFADTCIKDLESLKDNAESYKVAYDKIFNVKIKEYTKCYWIVEKMQERVHSVQEVKEFFDDFIDFYYPEEDAYFRKVNFIYKYFQYKLEDEQCFIEKEDLLDIIERCEKVLADDTKAEELLPTQCGFFFGSTDYDDYYFDNVADCKKQMEHLLEDFDDNTDIIYVVMSW